MFFVKARAQRMARQLIEGLGTAATFIRPQGTYDPETGAVSEDSIVWTGALLESQFSDTERVMGQGRIVDGDRKGLVSVHGTAPEPGDRVTVGGRTYSVVLVNLDLSEAYYELHLRRT